MKRNVRRGSASTRYLTRGALVAALYVALSYVATVFGLASGAIQFRISEALCILPVFMPEAIPGLFVGCIISNIIGGCVPWDIVCGSIATLLGALGAYALRKLPNKYKWAATLPNFFANVIIVPFVLMYAYAVEAGFFVLALSVGIGEAVCGVLCGSILYYSIKDQRIFK